MAKTHVSDGCSAGFLSFAAKKRPEHAERGAVDRAAVAGAMHVFGGQDMHPERLDTQEEPGGDLAERVAVGDVCGKREIADSLSERSEAACVSAHSR